MGVVTGRESEMDVATGRESRMGVAIWTWA